MTDKTESPELEPKGFDFGEWLAGLAPARRDYVIAGQRFTLQARTPAWFTKWGAGQPDDGEGVEQNLRFLAEHIVAPEGITVEQLKALKEIRENDVADMVRLAIDLTTKPESQISPRFLHSASD